MVWGMEQHAVLINQWGYSGGVSVAVATKKSQVGDFKGDQNVSIASNKNISKKNLKKKQQRIWKIGSLQKDLTN